MAKEKEEKVEAPKKKGKDLSNLSEKELKAIAKPDQVESLDNPRETTKEQMAAIIELYKRQNPAKYEVKKDRLAETLANCPD